MKKLVRVAVMTALLGFVHSATAQPSAVSAAAVKKAAEEFSQGKEAYRSGDYLEAAEHFETADESAPSVNALRAAMTSRKKGGQLDRAATLAELALERHPEDEKLAAEAQEILQTATTSLQRVTVSCDAPCSLVVGTSLVHGEPANERIVYLDPGSHEIRASWRGDSGTRSQVVEGEPGDEFEIDFEQPGVGFGATGVAPGGDDVISDPEEEPEDYFTDDDVTEDDETEQSSGLPPAVFAVGAVVTAGLGGVTVWSGLDTINSPGADNVKTECQGQGTDCALYKEGQQKETRTNVLIGATAVVGVATIIIGAAATDWGGKHKDAARQSKLRKRRTIEPWVTVGQGAAFGARGRF